MPKYSLFKKKKNLFRRIKFFYVHSTTLWNFLPMGSREGRLKPQPPYCPCHVTWYFWSGEKHVPPQFSNSNLKAPQPETSSLSLFPLPSRSFRSSRWWKPYSSILCSAVSGISCTEMPFSYANVSALSFHPKYAPSHFSPFFFKIM